MHTIDIVRRVQRLACALFVCLAAWPALAQADTLVATLGDHAQVREQLVGSVSYLMLPSCADLRALDLSCVDDDGNALAASVTCNGHTEQLGEGNVDLLAGSDRPTVYGGELGDAYVLSLATSEGTRHVHVKHSALIGSVFVDSERGRAYVDESPDHSTKDQGHLTVLDASGASVYDDALAQIKGRGNSTWASSPKKPYQIKLPTRADLLGGTQPSKTWILLANAGDPSLLRNSLALDLAKELGIPYAASCAPVDLYYDGCYRGSYLLTEKNEVAQWRVEISDLEDANDDANEGNPAWEDPVIAQATNAHGNQYQYVTDARDPADVSGGYLLEYDLHANDDDISFDTFLSSFTIKSPEPPTQGEARYISELVDDAFRALIIGEERGAEPGRYFDLEAFVRMGCLQEFVMDGDYLSVSSSYFAVEQGAGRLVACAPWDFDRAFPHDSQGPKGFARSALMGNPSLQRRFAALWRDELAPLVDAVLLGDEQALGTRGKLHSIAYYQHQVDASRRMDETLWGLAPMSDEWLVWDQSAQSFASACAALRSFARERASYLDAWTQSSLASGSWHPEGRIWRGNTVATVIDGQLQRGSFRDAQGVDCYADPELGVTLVGWNRTADGGRYYTDVDGVLQAAWVAIDEQWHYFDPATYLMRTGWVLDDGDWYYLDPASGIMRTGWLYSGSAWYYLSPHTGAMRTGWLAVDDTWYYLDASGAMHGGWLADGSTWYYLDPRSGALRTGWALVGGLWYHFGPSGAMTTGWLNDHGTWYYLSPETGEMLTGWVQVDDTWYVLDENGAWVA